MQHKAADGKVTIYLEGVVDTKNAQDVEEEITAIVDEAGASSVVLDASDLDYISSAGLRVVIRLLKRLGDVSITGTNPEVYDVFEMTGLTELMDVKRQMRSISIEDCKKIGAGATASVYRLDPETIVKVFNENVYMDMVEREHARAKAAFVAGIPTAIAYETVRVGDQFGTVFELLNARDMLTLIIEHREHLVDYVRSFACEIRKLHEIEVNPKNFPDVKARRLAMLPRLEGVALTHEEAETLKKMYEIVPERNTFVHGDCHPGNIMVQGDEFVFIDLSSAGMGHPIFDLTSMGIIYGISLISGREVYEVRRTNSEYLAPFDYDEVTTIWNTFLTAYLDSTDQDYIAKASRQIIAYSALGFLFVSIAMPGFLSEEKLQGLKRMALGYCEHLEPLCF